MNRTHSPIILCLAISVLWLAACASNQPRPSTSTQLDPQTVSVPEYREFLDKLSTAIAEGIPRELNGKERKRFDSVSADLDKLLTRHDSVDAMNQDQRVALLNLHEQLEAIVIGRDEDQILCRRQARVGTHFKTTTCKPVGEWRQEKDQAQHYFRQNYRSHLVPPEN